MRDLILKILQACHDLDCQATLTLEDMAGQIELAIHDKHTNVPPEWKMDSPDQWLNALARMCHQANSRWWYDPATCLRRNRNVGELLMLAVSELAEAMEGHRKNLRDDKLPNRKMFDVELVDCLIRIFDMAGAPEVGVEDLGVTFMEKMEYNSKREDHTNEARLAPGGKAY